MTWAAKNNRVFETTTWEGNQDTTWSLLTSTGDVVLDAKVSIWASWVVAGCEDDAAHCLDFADHTGHCWSGHDAILPNYEMVDLQEGEKQKTFFFFLL